MRAWPGGPRGEELLEPGRDPLQVLVAAGQDAGADQDVADVVHDLGRGHGIQVLVGQRPVVLHEPLHQGGGVPVGEPAQHGDRAACLGQRLSKYADLLAARAVPRPIGQLGEPVVQHAAGAAAIAQQDAGRAAATAAVVNGEPGARPADQLAAAGPGDQGLGGAAGMAGRWMGADVAVAGGTDRADRPAGLDWALFRAAAAGLNRQGDAAAAAAAAARTRSSHRGRPVAAAWSITMPQRSASHERPADCYRVQHRLRPYNGSNQHG